MAGMKSPDRTRHPGPDEPDNQVVTFDERDVREDPEATQELIESLEAESPLRKLSGIWAVIVTVIAAGLSLYAIYQTRNPSSAQVYRMAFLASRWP
jgi:hypothetical protein